MFHHLGFDRRLSDDLHDVPIRSSRSFWLVAGVVSLFLRHPTSPRLHVMYPMEFPPFSAPSPATVRTRVHFRPKGWFAVDARVTFAMDGRTIGEGSFLGGIACEIALPPGSHTLEATLKAGFITRKKQWPIHVPSSEEMARITGGPPSDGHGILDVHVLYSRFWGTFEKNLETHFIADPASLLAAAFDAAPADAPSLPRGPVVATWIVLAALVACFVVELALPVTPASGASPSIDTLVGLGGLDVAHTTAGQWFRLLSCTFLHADPIHLLFNGIAIAFGGYLVESIVGPRWFLALYFVGALGGSFVSLALNDGQMVSVGASGAALSLFGAGLFIAQTLPRAERGPVQFQLARVLFPSLIPIASHHGERVDIGAHLGGCIAGLVLGGFFFVAIRRVERGDGDVVRFRRSSVALALAMLCAAALPFTIHGVATAAYPAARDFAALRESLLPNTDLPGDQAPTPERVAQWLERYPDDPRVLLFVAEAARDREDWSDVDAAVAHGRETMPRFTALFDDASMATFRKAFDDLERDVALRRRLLPNKDLPSGTAEENEAVWKAHLGEWLERYPDDPRVREKALWQAATTDEAEAHAERGLANVATFERVLTRSNETRAWLEYGRAMVLFDRHRPRDAEAVLTTLCNGPETEAADFARQRGRCAANPAR